MPDGAEGGGAGMISGHHWRDKWRNKGLDKLIEPNNENEIIRPSLTTEKKNIFLKAEHRYV